MRQISLNEKLVVYFVILGISGLITVAVFSFYTSRQALLDRTFDQLTSVRVNKKMQIESFFRDRVRDIRLLAKTEEAKIIARQLSEADTGTSAGSFLEKPLIQYMVNYLGIARYYSNIFFVDSSRSILQFNPKGFENSGKIGQLESAEINALSGSEDFHGSEVKIYDIRLKPITNDPVIYISAPVNDYEGNSALVMEMTLMELNRIMLENNPKDGLGKSGESYLVGSDSLMKSQSRFQKNSILKTTVNTIGVREALSGNSGISVIDDYRKISVLSSFSPLNVPGLNWVILAEIDTAEAMSPIRNLLADYLLIGLFAAILIFVFAYVLARRITSPIIKLKTAAGNISGGNMDVKLPITSNDEIGELTSAFNQMAGQLHQQQQQLSQEKKKRLRSIIDGQEKERQRLSRDLHDGLGQSLVAIKLQLENYCESASSGDNEKMEKIKNYFEQTIEDIRRMSNDLAPSVLDEFGLTTALKNLSRNLSQSAGIPIQFKTSGTSLQMPNKTRIYIYRICQEALTNAVKHAGATLIEVKLDFEDQTIKLEIKDNGKGFDTESTDHAGGNGLNNLQERAQILNGFIQIIAAPGHGTRIRFECKIKNS